MSASSSLCWHFSSMVKHQNIVSLVAETNSSLIMPWNRTEKKKKEAVGASFQIEINSRIHQHLEYLGHLF